MTTVLTLGTFDRLHVGHLELLRACRRMAGPEGRVVVAVNGSEFVERFKGHGTLFSTAARMEMLRALRDVDEVIPNIGAEYAGQAIGRVQPNVIAVGDDWAPPRDYLGQLHVTQAWLDEHHIRVVYVPRTTGESTTSIRDRLTAVA